MSSSELLERKAVAAGRGCGGAEVLSTAMLMLAGLAKIPINQPGKVGNINIGQGVEGHLTFSRDDGDEIALQIEVGHSWRILRSGATFLVDTRLAIQMVGEFVFGRPA